jgi:hypothetical protein
VKTVNAVRIVAALLAALCWFMSARTKLTRVRAGLEELDKVTQLADDLQMMGKWNAHISPSLRRAGRGLGVLRHHGNNGATPAWHTRRLCSWYFLAIVATMSGNIL